MRLSLDLGQAYRVRRRQVRPVTKDVRVCGRDGWPDDQHRVFASVDDARATLVTPEEDLA